MKKIIVFLFVLTISLNLIVSERQVVIPKESIRYRIIANSNLKEDQKEKWNINSLILPQIITSLNESKSIDETRDSLSLIVPEIQSNLEKQNINAKVNFGYNNFPEKTYKGVKYASGNYESLVITLGSGAGDNFWCVLFPPLCLLEASSNDLSEIEYRSYIKDIINKF